MEKTGVVILVSSRHRELFMATGNVTKHILTDPICQIIVDDFFIPAFKEGDYYTGLMNGVDEAIRQWSLN